MGYGGTILIPRSPSRWKATQRVMVVKLTILTHKIAIQLHLVAESCTICSSRSWRPVRKVLDTPSYLSDWLISPLVIEHEDLTLLMPNITLGLHHEPVHHSSHPQNLMPTLILFSSLFLGFGSGYFPRVFPTNILYAFLFSCPTELWAPFAAHFYLRDISTLKFAWPV
jgi:hypothetical protein